MGERLEARLNRRAFKRGWSVAKKNAIQGRKEKRRERTKTGFGKVGDFVKTAIVGASEIAVSATPFAAVAGDVAEAMLPKSATKIPLVGDVLLEARESAAERAATVNNGVEAVLAEFMPAWDHFRDGEYVKGIASLATFGGMVYYALIKFGVI